MILAFSVWVSITTGGMDVGAHVLFEGRPPVWMDSCGLTMPVVSIADPDWTQYCAGIIEHEMTHAQHFSALGPAFPVAYVLSGGAPFEHYRGDKSMWEPPPRLERSCPVVRFDFDVREMTFMPCWEGVVAWR